MEKIKKIITVGLTPCWDITCVGSDLSWQTHSLVKDCTKRPAGKALNISLALAEQGKKSIAAGLWGIEDYPQMKKKLVFLKDKIAVKMTAAAGDTRVNVTVIDKARSKEMHLRSKSSLADKKSLAELKQDMAKHVTRNCLCVFAGALPPKTYWPDVDKIINMCRRKGGNIVLDSSGAAIKRFVSKGGLFVIKPNLEELGQIVSRKVADNLTDIVKTAQGLLEKSSIILVSRGPKGAIAVTKDGSWTGSFVGKRINAASTVGCGDWLLAGFISGLADGCDAAGALRKGLQTATKKACGLKSQARSIQVKLV